MLNNHPFNILGCHLDFHLTLGVNAPWILKDVFMNECTINSFIVCQQQSTLGAT
jgi:hypothetical protein